jgi:hypothetical protein
MTQRTPIGVSFQGRFPGPTTPLVRKLWARQDEQALCRCRMPKTRTIDCVRASVSLYVRSSRAQLRAMPLWCPFDDRAIVKSSGSVVDQMDCCHIPLPLMAACARFQCSILAYSG